MEKLKTNKKKKTKKKVIRRNKDVKWREPK